MDRALEGDSKRVATSRMCIKQIVKAEVQQIKILVLVVVQKIGTP